MLFFDQVSILFSFYRVHNLITCERFPCSLIMPHVRYRAIVALAFLIVCQMLCAAEAQSCRNEYSASGMTLKGHAFNKTKATNWPKCVQACNDDVICQSVNYVVSEGMCELNNRTKKARPDDFVPGKGRAYMTRLSQRGIVTSSCVSLFFFF